MVTSSGRYRIGWLILSQALAVLIVVSWLVPPTAGWWEMADVASFRALNAPLDPESTATLLWAWLNVRAADLVPALILIGLTLLAAGSMPPGPRERLTHRGLAFALVMGFVLTVENLIDFGVYSYRRNSPSLVLDDVVRLSEVVPAAKDFSAKSFPGDHGFVLICSAIFFALSLPRAYGLAAIGVAIMFTLPRMVAGAHWMTDIVVGSGAKAMIAMGWLVATPLWDCTTASIARFLAALPIDPVHLACRWKGWSGVAPDAGAEREDMEKAVRRAA